MTDLTPETRAEWRKDAAYYVHMWGRAQAEKEYRILALLDALDEAERNWQLDADRMHEAREALARVEALRDECAGQHGQCWNSIFARRITAALAGPTPTDTEED